MRRTIVKGIIIFVPIVFCLLLGQVISAQGAEGTPLSCYVGNPDDDQYLGDVEVFTLAGAASICNRTYSDCNGNCTACYIAEDGSQICIDVTGRQYVNQ
ncbi:MAG TPA: hypothetical protein DCP92_09975 [Nitrospiraceae bacterium]|jgi:hypothetical protein|nr:hypothetical protein [Nitrospiraceae bacterium]